VIRSVKGRRQKKKTDSTSSSGEGGQVSKEAGRKKVAYGESRKEPRLANSLRGRAKFEGACCHL